MHIKTTPISILSSLCTKSQFEQIITWQISSLSRQKKQQRFRSAERAEAISEMRETKGCRPRWPPTQIRPVVVVVVQSPHIPYYADMSNKQVYCLDLMMLHVVPHY